MTERTMFERDLVAWMRDETAGGMPEPALAEALESTIRVRPTVAWVARLRHPAMRWQRRTAVGTPRRWLTVVAVAGLLMLGLLAAVAAGWRPFESDAGPDWSGYRGGSGRTGLGGVGPVGRPTLHWRFAAGDSVKDAIAIAGDLVIAPAQNGVLRAIAIEDGTERWRFAPGTSISAPYVDGDLVVVVDGRGIAHGLQLGDGSERWTSPEVLGSVNSPIVADGLVILGTGSGDLVALDIRTGQRRWSVTLSGGAVRDPAAADGVVYAGTEDGVLFAVRSSDGSTIWSRDFQGSPLGTPTVAGGMVYSGGRSDQAGGRLRALDAATGDLIWQTDDPWFAPSVAAGLAVSGRDDGLIVARDARTGVERWRFASGGSTRGPAISGSKVIFDVDNGHWVGALDLATGGFLWRYDVDGSNQCCIAIAKGYVVVGTMRGSIYLIGGDGSVLSPGTAPPETVGASVSPVPTPPASTATAIPSIGLPEPYRIVERLDPAITGLENPLALAVGPSGDVFVTDLSMRVTRIRPDGAVSHWGRPGDRPGEFDFEPAAANANPAGAITVGLDGTVYVSDSDNHRIQAFTPDGRFLRGFGSLGSEAGQFTIPFDLGVDGDGNAYVADDGLMRLTKFDPAGRPLWVVDGTTDPRLDGHLHTPRIDANGRITVANDDQGTVVNLDPDGTVVDAFPAPGCGVSVDAAGRYHTVGCGGGVRVFDATHAEVAASRDQSIVRVEFGSDGSIVALDRTGAVLRLGEALRAPASPSP